MSVFWCPTCNTTYYKPITECFVCEERGLAVIDNPIDVYAYLLDVSEGSFSFISRGVHLTHDYRRIYNRLIASRDWKTA